NSFEPIPMWVDEGSGAHFRDVDGHDYLDTNVADMSMFTGYGPEPVVRAVARRMAQGSQFMAPSEDSVWVAEELAGRYAVPLWQFTLSATHANTEAVRVARAVTGREVVAFFDGHYHGHFDETLVGIDDGVLVAEEAGLPSDVVDRVLVLPFNDVAELERALASRTVAAVLTEPAMTNNVGLVLPVDDYHQQLRRITREAGTLLVLDETHTQVVGPGGLTRMWSLEPDIVTIGKSIAGGVPLGAYGMRAEVAEVLQRPLGRDDPKPLVATGGTLFGNPLSMAAARATMEEVLTDEAYAHATALGERLAQGLEQLVSARGLPWTVQRFWPRSGLAFAPTAPRDAREAYEHLDVPLRRLSRVYLANRGVWDALVGAGPTMGTAATDADVDLYVDVTAALLDEVLA
ncbi:MAG TPA: aminotransferase class III-fold pyridoxal phosphate-dependent enzyme, partial [Candidatus Nanopelagicales bacterium]|nr:aminotransferase class III-fold pyridoxal phosphate-dependent enzyme [Candidatus Nanopelagicales bacterium]